jgi:hypothetical protein
MTDDLPDIIYPSGSNDFHPLCYADLPVDDLEPNQTLPVDVEIPPGSEFTVNLARWFNIRTDKFRGMHTKKPFQDVKFKLHVPYLEPFYNKLGILSLTENTNAWIALDKNVFRKINMLKDKTVHTKMTYINQPIYPGEHELHIRSAYNGFMVLAIVLG